MRDGRRRERLEAVGETLRVKYRAETGGREEAITVAPRADGRFAVTFGGCTYVADLRRIGKTAIFSLLVGARSCEVAAIRDRAGWRIDLKGSSFLVCVETEQERHGGSALPGPGDLEAVGAVGERALAS